MKKRIAILLLATAMALLSGGCSDGKDPLLGKWAVTIEGITITREFKADGTVVERVSDMPARMEGTYTVDGNKITIAMTLFVNEETGANLPIEVDWEFSYTADENKLILIDLNLGDGEEVTYTKET